MEQPEYMKVNQELVDVYKDTLLEATSYAHGHTVKVDYNNFLSLDMKRSTLKIDGDGDRAGNLEVVNIDTIGALQKYRGDYNTILNMASAKRLGGGVSWGARAQEEGLFRCSNLAMCISVDEYPLAQSQGLYTQNAVFFKDFHYNKIKPITCDVITIAAIKVGKEEMPVGEYELVTENKIRLMIKLAYKRDTENLILGAWGCGVYKNDPSFIATLFKKILIEEGAAKHFNNVIFAVINDHNSVGSNYEIFKNILG